MHEAGHLHAQPAAVRERSLAEGLNVACLVEDLRRKVELHLVKTVGDLHQPAHEHLVGVVLLLRDVGEDLVESGLHVFGQRFDRAPGDLCRRRPTFPDRQLVEVDGVVCPDLVLIEDRIGSGQATPIWGRRPGAPRRIVLERPVVGRPAIGAGVRLAQRKPLRTEIVRSWRSLRGHACPGHVERWWLEQRRPRLRRLLQLFVFALCGCIRHVALLRTA